MSDDQWCPPLAALLGHNPGVGLTRDVEELEDEVELPASAGRLRLDLEEIPQARLELEAGAEWARPLSRGSWTGSRGEGPNAQFGKR